MVSVISFAIRIHSGDSRDSSLSHNVRPGFSLLKFRIFRFQRPTLSVKTLPYSFRFFFFLKHTFGKVKQRSWSFEISTFGNCRGRTGTVWAFVWVRWVRLRPLRETPPSPPKTRPLPSGEKSKKKTNLETGLQTPNFLSLSSEIANNISSLHLWWDASPVKNSLLRNFGNTQDQSLSLSQPPLPQLSNHTVQKAKTRLNYSPRIAAEYVASTITIESRDNRFVSLFLVRQFSLSLPWMGRGRAAAACRARRRFVQLFRAAYNQHISGLLRHLSSLSHLTCFFSLSFNQNTTLSFYLYNRL